MSSLIYRPLTTPYKPWVTEFVNATVWGIVALAAILDLFVFGYSPWLFAGFCWLLGAATLAFTWRPKPDKEWDGGAAIVILLIYGLVMSVLVSVLLIEKTWALYAAIALSCAAAAVFSVWWYALSDQLKKNLSLTAGQMHNYCLQLLWLSVYRFFQLLQNPYVLWKTASEIRNRPDYFTEHAAYLRAKQQWSTAVVARSDEFIVLERRVGIRHKITWIEFGRGFTPQQFRFLRKCMEPAWFMVRMSPKDEERVTKALIIQVRPFAESQFQQLADRINEARMHVGDRANEPRVIDGVALGLV